ncbi:MAG: alpha/beta fold hydrolase [Selenomonadaceae bacterium]|nr:alpha/beta fold hydrolase [Selenomonadaceae bacterium]
MESLNVETRRGTVLNGVLFPAKASDTVVIAITGIHGNFYSNPFYYNIGDTLSTNGIDFIYAQTNDAYGEIETSNAKTGAKEIIGSWNERFSYTEEDIDAYLDCAAKKYRHVILAGHSLGANKVIYYLSKHHDKKRVEHFILMSPANLSHMMSGVSDDERDFVEKLVRYGHGEKILPFYFMGWVICTANTAHDWLSGILDNTNNFSQLEQINHTGALIIGTYDNFTDGNPVCFLKNINSHMKTAAANKLIFIERTGHTYQQKHQEIAEIILKLAADWTKH